MFDQPKPVLTRWAPKSVAPTTSIRRVDAWKRASQTIPEPRQLHLETKKALEREAQFQKSAGAHYAAKYQVYEPSPMEIMAAQGLIFDGGMVGVDASWSIIEDPTMTVAQFSVCAFRHHGEPDADVRLHRKFFQHWPSNLDPTRDIDKVVAARSGDHEHGVKLKIRTEAAIVEREVALGETARGLVMAHGFPAPKTELFNMGQTPEQVASNIKLTSDLMLSGRVVFVQSETYRQDLVSGKAYALTRPGQFTLFNEEETLQPELDDLAHHGYRGARWTPVASELKAFAADVGPNVLIGAFRAHWQSPNYLFFAHRRFAYSAGLLCLAAAKLEPLRGFPELLDLADQHANAYAKQADLEQEFQAVNGAAGPNLRHIPERRSRPWIK